MSIFPDNNPRPDSTEWELLSKILIAENASSGGGGGTGTVTSVGLSDSTGLLTVTGTPVTTSGTINVALQNSVNGASGLVQLNGSSQLPAVSGANLTGLTPSNLNGAVPLINGGTGTAAASANAAFNALSPMSFLGDSIYGGTSGAATRLAGNTGTGRAFLTQTGTGAVSAAPVWYTLFQGSNTWNGGGSNIFETATTFTSTVSVSNSSGIDLTTSGGSLTLLTNVRAGTATLNGTTAVVISNTTVTNTSIILLTIQVPVGTVGSPYVSARTAGTSFSIKSGTLDTSTVGWVIFETGSGG